LAGSRNAQAQSTQELQPCRGWQHSAPSPGSTPSRVGGMARRMAGRRGARNDRAQSREETRQAM